MASPLNYLFIGVLPVLESLTLQPIAPSKVLLIYQDQKVSLTVRLLLVALAKGKTRLTNLLDSDDIRHMLNALKSLRVYHYQITIRYVILKNRWRI